MDLNRRRRKTIPYSLFPFILSIFVFFPIPLLLDLTLVGALKIGERQKEWFSPARGWRFHVPVVLGAPARGRIPRLVNLSYFHNLNLRAPSLSALIMGVCSKFLFIYNITYRREM